MAPLCARRPRAAVVRWGEPWVGATLRVRPRDASRTPGVAAERRASAHREVDARAPLLARALAALDREHASRLHARGEERVARRGLAGRQQRGDVLGPDLYRLEDPLLLLGGGRRTVVARRGLR